MSLAEDCLRFSKLFEAEHLTELMLRFWDHPLADDEVFKKGLVEGAHEILSQSVEGQAFMEGIKPSEMNFVAAVWYVEWSSIADVLEEDPNGGRREWLNVIHRAVPSCFCSQNDLHDF